MPTFCASNSLASGRLSILRTPTSLVTLRGKEWCVASARTRATHSVSGTPRCVELSKAGALFSSKHHHTCCLLPGGFRRYRIWKLQCLTSATTASTRTNLHTKTRYRMRKAVRVLCTSTPTSHYLFLHPGVLRLGEPHRRNHRLQLHLYLRLRQKRGLHPCLHRRHRKQPPRTPTATPCNPVLPAPLLVVQFVRLQLQTIGQIGTTAQLW